MIEPAGLDAQSLRDMRQRADEASQIYEEGYAMRASSRPWLRGQVEALARDVVALTDEVGRLVGCVAEAERRAKQAEREVPLQMQSKLDAQLTLLTVVEALDLRRQARRLNQENGR